MPAHRTIIAAQEDAYLERVRSAAAHGGGWGAMHEAQGRRCVLPGAGEVHWRCWDELLFVDALTAFRLEPGESYQLRHEGARDHFVLCEATTDAPPHEPRAWLVAPRQLFELMRACRRLGRGEARLADVRDCASESLARAYPIDGVEPCTTLMRARQIIAQQACDDLPLEELAAAVNCSPFHLTRLFRRALGTTPHQYHLRLRLALALRQLQAGESDLAALAHDLGFSSQSHFGEAFRRGVGCTPSNARRELA